MQWKQEVRTHARRFHAASLRGYKGQSKVLKTSYLSAFGADPTSSCRLSHVLIGVGSTVLFTRLRSPHNDYVTWLRRAIDIFSGLNKAFTHVAIR